MARHYRKKPVVIEAIRYLPPNNCDEVWAFLGWQMTDDPVADIDAAYHDPECDGTVPVYIETLEGHMEASPGDWIIKGIKGEFYPCKPDIFEATYEPAEPEAEMVTCPKCQGRRTVPIFKHVAATGRSMLDHEIPCPRCGGSGTVSAPTEASDG